MSTLDFVERVLAHNPFLCGLCSTGRQDQCPSDRAARVLSEDTVFAHAEGGGHYLLCDCAWCASQRQYHHNFHDERCLRKDSSTCRSHGYADCHCDCAKR